MGTIQQRVPEDFLLRLCVPRDPPCVPCAISTVDGLAKDDIDINLNHDHGAFFSLSGLLGELPRLIGEDGVPYIVYLGVYVAYFLTT